MKRRLRALLLRCTHNTTWSLCVCASQIAILSHSNYEGVQPGIPLRRTSVKPNEDRLYQYTQMRTLLHRLLASYPSLQGVILHVCRAAVSLRPTFLQNIVFLALPFHVAAFLEVVKTDNLNTLRAIAYTAALHAPQGHDPLALEPVKLVRRKLTADFQHGAAECILHNLAGSGVGDVMDHVFAAALMVPSGIRRSNVSFSVFSPTVKKIIRFTEAWLTRDQYLLQLEALRREDQERAAATAILKQDAQPVPEVILNMPPELTDDDNLRSKDEGCIIA